MIRRPPSSTLNDQLLPYTPLFRSSPSVFQYLSQWLRLRPLPRNLDRYNDRPSPVSLANAQWSHQALRMAMDQRVFSSSSTHRIIDNFRRTTRIRYQERRNLDLLGEYISDIRTVGCIMLLGAVAFVGIDSAHWAVYKVRPLQARLSNRK